MESKLLKFITTISFDSTLTILKKLNAVLDNIFESEHHDLKIELKNKIAEIDLHDKLKEIEAFIKDLQNLQLEKIGKESIMTSIDSIRDVIEIIHKNLDDIANKMVSHKDKYMSTWRSINCQENIDNIIKYDLLLTLRYNRLKDLMKIPWNVYM